MISSSIRMSKMMQKSEIQKQYEQLILSKNYIRLISDTSTIIQKQSSLSQSIPIQRHEYFYSQDEQYKLGKGSYGSVYKCYIKKNSIIYREAVKIIQIQLCKKKLVSMTYDKLNKTNKEIEALKKLKDNRHIIKIGDTIKQGNRIYIILQYCNNQDLESYFKRLKEQSPYELNSIEKINKFYAQLLYGFKSLVQNNYVHRDIKPGNILVNDGGLRVADFGLAHRIYEKDEVMEDFVGTKCTAAPQIRFLQKYTAKCDIFSMGVLYYWMIYGQYPFDDKLQKEDFVKYQVVYPKQSIYGFKVPQEVIELISKMLKYSQNQRPEWQELFMHRFFLQHLKNMDESSELRKTLGRDIQNINSQDFKKIVPLQLHKYIIQQRQFLRLSNNELEELEQFVILARQIRNFKIKISFFKQLLKELVNHEPHQNLSNQTEEKTICDIIRLGVQKYTMHLSKKLQNETKNQSIPEILDRKLLMKFHDDERFINYCQTTIKQFQSFQKSQQKLKLSSQQIKLLLKKCEEYQVTNQFPIILTVSFQKLIIDGNELKLQEQLVKAIIEMIFLLKNEVKNQHARYSAITSQQQKRFKSLILLIHHLNMFVMNRQVFPHTEKLKLNNFDYEPSSFIEKQKFKNKEQFDYLCEQIMSLLDRFQD